MSITGACELLLEVCDGPGPIFQVNVISIQSQWDSSFALSTNPLINYKINTCEQPLNLTDSGLERYSDVPEVIGCSVFKQNPSSSGQKGSVT